MPSDMRMLADPAVLMSAPKTSTSAGISNSPPATPSTLLTIPTPTPITRPAPKWRHARRQQVTGRLERQYCLGAGSERISPLPLSKKLQLHRPEHHFCSIFNQILG